MMYKRKKLNDNNLQPQKPRKRSGFKKLEYQMSDDYLISIIEDYENDGTIAPTPTTTNHNFSFIEPKLVTEIAGKNTLSTVPSYFVLPTFEYLALDWEAKFGQLNELQSPMLYTEEGGAPKDKVLSYRGVSRTIARNPDILDKFFTRRTQEETNKHKNILFGAKYQYKRKNHLKKNYPFYVNVAFNFKTKKEFKTRLRELGVYELLIEDYVQASKDFVAFGEETLPTFDFIQWLNNSDFEIDDSNIKILSPSYTKPNNFFYNLKKLNLIGFTRQMIKAKQRRIRELLHNQESYNEIMFYRFDKYDNRSNRLIQSFWLPADDAVSFIDTQVKYGTLYRYSCSAHILVIGASYSASETNTGIRSVINPSIKIIEVPMFEETCNVIQPPQPLPDVKFMNSKYERNDINISVKLNSNYYNAEFIPLEERELAQNDLVAEYNKLNQRPYFHYETEHALFEVFRMEEMPKNWDEVDNYKIAEIRHPVPSTATLLKQKVSVGKKYYYVFRSINSHGLLSNPSPIYEIEMKEDADESFLEVKTVEFIEEERYQSSRTMTKDIQILPSALHTIFDQSQAPVSLGTLRGKAKNLNLGIAEKPIWGKKFKFRITSKDTGKKIDINVDVELTKNKTIEDFK